MKNKKKLILLSLVQFLILLALLGNIMYFKHSANTFKIESESLDPIEPLFGHYAALSYDFDSINVKDWKGKVKPKEGNIAFIVFRKDGQSSIYKFDYATDQRPKHSKYIKVKILYSYWNGDSGDEITFKHNLSRFYIPESQMDKYNKVRTNYIVTVQQKNDRSVVKSVDVLGK
ncbi:GDYXXLXY domain-containing protein [Gottfriedia luciferensis]|uniref:GDYXXLXY domain-containing protein n=1 Tax=Gottfriedia luciferensis TaxID=178774 RepID=UPI001302CC6E|nr:GDYXXLXY domain-containing protein [Gottfriedia luciferensis]